MVNWKQAEQSAKAGKGKMVNGARVLQPADLKGGIFYMPLAKSPHGVDIAPSGRWIIGSGKLSPTTTVYDMEKINAAIAAKDFSDEVDDIPVLNYTSVRVAEIPVGLGPLHTQFDDKGNAQGCRGCSLRRNPW